MDSSVHDNLLQYFVRTDGSDYELLHTFAATEGSSPQTELLKTDATTYFGSVSSSGACGNGAVFRLSLNGNLSSDGKTSCEVTSSGSGGGAVDLELLLFLLALGLATRPRGRNNKVAGEALSQN